MSTSVADAYALIGGLVPGSWAAISLEQNRVIACGADPEAVLHEAQNAGETDPLMMKVPENPSILFA